MLGISFHEERSADSLRAVRTYPDRFFGSYEVDPNRGMDAVRDLRRAVEEFGVKAATAFPAGLNPQVPINDERVESPDDQHNHQQQGESATQ